MDHYTKTLNPDGTISVVDNLEVAVAQLSDIAGIVGSMSGGVFDQVITTQAEFEALIASSTWLDAVSVCFVGNGGTLKFTNATGILIPATVKQIQGVNNAIIRVSGFRYDPASCKGALWYTTLPTTADYSISNLTVECAGIGVGTSYSFYNCTQLENCIGVSSSLSLSAAFYNCTKLVNCTGGGAALVGAGFENCTKLVNCAGDGTGTGLGGTRTGCGFKTCVQLMNCTGTGIGVTSGWGYYDCSYLSNCMAGTTASTTALLGGTNTQIDDITVA